MYQETFRMSCILITKTSAFGCVSIKKLVGPLKLKIFVLSISSYLRSYQKHNFSYDYFLAKQLFLKCHELVFRDQIKLSGYI